MFVALEMYLEKIMDRNGSYGKIKIKLYYDSVLTVMGGKTENFMCHHMPEPVPSLRNFQG